MDHDPINKPAHYNTGGQEVIEIIEDRYADSYHLGNAVKYLLRAKYKGHMIEDIGKCVWYLQRWLDNQQESDMISEGGPVWFECVRCGNDCSIVDSKGVCIQCIEREGPVSPSKTLDLSSKVIHHNSPESGLEARTERRIHYRETFYPDGSEQLVMKELQEYG